tara:strand:- start:2328 stop:3359 length:1032 start_codon:yes stop_codon:yes gene_type:complete
MCEFLKDENQCKKKCMYGNYCNKHKKNYLVKDNIIIYERFTNKSSDYLKGDILSTLKIKDKKHYLTLEKNKKKEYYFDAIVNFIDSFKKYNEKDIIKIQSNIRRKNMNNNTNLRGKGYFNRKLCNNDEDFFTYEPKENIEDIYFISYTDDNNLTWCFDVRSFNKLLQFDCKNPYTRENFPENFILKSKTLTKILKNKNLKLNHNSEIAKERKNNIKQLTVDLFSEIEISGYDCNIQWFLDLNIRNLKKLYKVLEDIWNYRAQLSQEVKNNIVPPNGIIFNTSIYDINRITIRRELQELIINEASKFKTAVTQSDKNLGFMYFLIGLGNVSHECYLTYSWLING